MPLTQKSITAKLHRLGYEARLESGGGYFQLPRVGAVHVAGQDCEGPEGEQLDAGAVGGRVPEVEEGQ